MIQGLTGHVAVQRDPGTPVDLVRNIVCDKSTSYTAAQAITAALFARERGAGGQHVKLSMIDAGLAFFWCDGMMAHTFVGEGAMPGLPLYDLYKLRETADGHCVVFAASDSEFQGLCRALNTPDLAEDPRFATLGDRIVNMEPLETRFAEEFKKWPTHELVERVSAEDVPAGPGALPRGADRGSAKSSTTARSSRSSTRRPGRCARRRRRPDSTRRPPPPAHPRRSSGRIPTRC